MAVRFICLLYAHCACLQKNVNVASVYIIYQFIKFKMLHRRSCSCMWYKEQRIILNRLRYFLLLLLFAQFYLYTCASSIKISESKRISVGGMNLHYSVCKKKLILFFCFIITKAFLLTYVI